MTCSLSPPPIALTTSEAPPLKHSSNQNNALSLFPLPLVRFRRRGPPLITGPPMITGPLMTTWPPRVFVSPTKSVWDVSWTIFLPRLPCPCQTCSENTPPLIHKDNQSLISIQCTARRAIPIPRSRQRPVVSFPWSSSRGRDGEEVELLRRSHYLSHFDDTCFVESQTLSLEMRLTLCLPEFLLPSLAMPVLLRPRPIPTALEEED